VQTLEVGQRIKLGGDHVTIGWIGENRVGVVFEDGQKSVYSKEFLEKQAAHRHHQSDDNDVLTPDPDNFFVVREPDASKHVMGDKWAPFGDNAAEAFFDHLPEIMPTADVYWGYTKTTRPEVRSLPIGEPALLLYIDSDELPGTLKDPALLGQGRVNSNNGVAIVAHVERDKKANMFKVAFPYVKESGRHTLRLKQLHLWESEVEAQLVTTLGDTEVTFFDSDFICNRSWYRRDVEYQFELTGIAYSAEKCEVTEIKINRDNEHFELMEWLTGEDCYPADGSMKQKVDIRNMTTFWNTPELDHDEYKFRGSVQSVQPEVIIGQKAWRLSVAFLPEKGVEVDVIVTEKAWQSEMLPQAGDVIRGLLWLQGRMVGQAA
jgi:hypothetical protein